MSTANNFAELCKVGVDYTGVASMGTLTVDSTCKLYSEVRMTVQEAGDPVLSNKVGLCGFFCQQRSSELEPAALPPL